MGCFYGWLACGGGAVAWALLEINVLYHDDCSHISLASIFCYHQTKHATPFISSISSFVPLFFLFLFPLTRDQMNLSFFPVFWLTGYNLHMYFVLLYATYIRHHHHLSSSIMSYSRERVSRGERKKKALQVPVCIVHNLLSVRHMYVMYMYVPSLNK